MSIDPLLVRARGLWEDLASVPVSFAPIGGVSVVVSPESGMCPAGWVGVVALGGSAIVTAPSEDAAVIVRDAFATLPVETVADADVVRDVLPVARVLGPAALAYVFRGGRRRRIPGLAEADRPHQCADRARVARTGAGPGDGFGDDHARPRGRAAAAVAGPGA